MRILAMVPIYSTTSWLQLIVTNERTKLTLELLRDSYEAYVIYNFVVLLIKYAGGDLHLCRYLEDQPRMQHTWPLRLWLAPVKPGPAFLNFIRASVLQFVLVKPTGALLKLYSVEKLSDHMQTLVRIVMVLVNNASVSLALYGLVMFYHAAHDVLLDHEPLPKFISVKAVVFFSFWQGVAIQLAIRAGVLHDVKGVSATEQATGLQDLLICLEMFIAAVAHYFVFSYKEYQTQRHDGASPALSRRRQLVRNFADIFDFRDVLSDARDRLQGGKGFGTELRDGPPVLSTSAVFGDDEPLAYDSRRNRGVRRDDRRSDWVPRPLSEVVGASTESCLLLNRDETNNNR